MTDEEQFQQAIIDRMEELQEQDEHALDTVYSDDLDARDGAYYELSRLKTLIEIDKI